MKTVIIKQPYKKVAAEKPIRHSKKKKKRTVQHTNVNSAGGGIKQETVK